jgi:hypothetical protein
MNIITQHEYGLSFGFIKLFMLPLPLRALILLSNWTEVFDFIKSLFVIGKKHRQFKLITFFPYKSMYSLLFLPLTNID